MGVHVRKQMAASLFNILCHIGELHKTNCSDESTCLTNSFFKYISTGDEKRVPYDNVQRKRKCIDKHKSSQRGH